MFRLYICLGWMFYLFSCYNTLLMLVRLITKPTWLGLENVMLITWRRSKISPQTWTAVGCLAASFIISPPPCSSLCVCDLTCLVQVSTLNVSVVCGILETELNTVTVKLCGIFYDIDYKQWVYLSALLPGWPPSVNTFSLKTLKSP